MENLDKVITAMECCTNDKCFKCSYGNDGNPSNANCMAKCREDALDLLKKFRRRMPCEVGSTVFHIHQDRVIVGTVREIRILDAEGNGFIHADFEDEEIKHVICDLKLWNIDLFPTREAAETALRETCGNCKHGEPVYQDRVYKCCADGACQWEEKKEGK